MYLHSFYCAMVAKHYDPLLDSCFFNLPPFCVFRTTNKPQNDHRARLRVAYESKSRPSNTKDFEDSDRR